MRLLAIAVLGSIALSGGCEKGGDNKFVGKVIGWGGSDTPLQIDLSEKLPSGSIRRFADDAEMENYIAVAVAINLNSAATSTGAGEEDSAGVPGVDESRSTNEVITNNQEGAVDEGDIVKNIDHYLITLHKGRLYSVDIQQAAAPKDIQSMQVASQSNLSTDVWYDEMLVAGDKLFVIGYRFQIGFANGEDGNEENDYNYTGATEINSFQLVDGHFQRLETSFFESWDYYSWRNFASRMVNGELIIYTPMMSFSTIRDGAKLRIPHRLTVNNDGKFARGPFLFHGSDVIVPVEVTASPSYHILTKCSLNTEAKMDCRSSALLSNWSREFYVTTKNLFLWTGNHVYSLDIATGDALVHRTVGLPIDQFSFKEVNGTLNLITQNGWNNFCGTDRAADDGPSFVKLLRLPESAFDEFGEQDLGSAQVLDLLTDKTRQTWIWNNRFVGNSALIGINRYENGSDGFGHSSQSILIIDITTGTTTELPTNDWSTRIEPLGDDRALVVGEKYDYNYLESTMSVSIIDLATTPTILSTKSYPSTRVGEYRSHGFFYKATGNGEGLMGLAVISETKTDSFDAWWNQASSVMFSRLGKDGAVETIGTTVPTATKDSPCDTSCVDWYGNTRPIFMQNRTFALMGTEVQEIELSDGKLTKLGSNR